MSLGFETSKEYSSRLHRPFGGNLGRTLYTELEKVVRLDNSSPAAVPIRALLQSQRRESRAIKVRDPMLSAPDYERSRSVRSGGGTNPTHPLFVADSVFTAPPSRIPSNKGRLTQALLRAIESPRCHI